MRLCSETCKGYAVALPQRLPLLSTRRARSHRHSGHSILIESSPYSNAMRHGPLDQKMIFHPQQTWRICLRDNRSVDDDLLWWRRGSLLPRERGLHASYDRTSMNAARGVAHGRVHAAIHHRTDGRRHRVDAANQDLRAMPRPHHLQRGERHVVVVEECGADVLIGVEVPLHSCTTFA